jgi:hypothetical protein
VSNSAQVPPPQPASKSNTAVIIIVVVAVLGLVVVALIGVMASLGIYGFRKYLSQAKEAEGRNGVSQLARGMVVCAEKRIAEGGALPKSSRPVPASLAAISGKKYMSATSDWTDDAYTCASFDMSYPQYFQYQWLLDPSGRTGVARAAADLDGDGTAEITFELPVACGADGTCAAAPALTEKRH